MTNVGRVSPKGGVAEGIPTRLHETLSSASPIKPAGRMGCGPYAFISITTSKS